MVGGNNNSVVWLLLAAIEARRQKNQAESVVLYEKALKLAEEKWGKQNSIVDAISKELNGIAAPPKDYDQN